MTNATNIHITIQYKKQDLDYNYVRKYEVFGLRSPLYLTRLTQYMLFSLQRMCETCCCFGPELIWTHNPVDKNSKHHLGTRVNKYGN